MTIDRISQQIRVGGDRLLSSTVKAGGSLAELTNDLLNIRMRISNFGRGQLNEELKRQTNAA